MWEWLAKDFLVKGTVGDLLVIFLGGLFVGVLMTVMTYEFLGLKKLLQKKREGGEK